MNNWSFWYCWLLQKWKSCLLQIHSFLIYPLKLICLSIQFRTFYLLHVSLLCKCIIIIRHHMVCLSYPLVSRQVEKVFPKMPLKCPKIAPLNWMVSYDYTSIYTYVKCYHLKIKIGLFYKNTQPVSNFSEGHLRPHTTLETSSLSLSVHSFSRS